MGRREYLRAIYDRYHRGSPEQKGAILDEFCRVCQRAIARMIDFYSRAD